MKKLLVLFLLVMTFQVQAQNAEEEVKAVIQTLFDGMREKDGDKVASAFDPDALMQTIRVTEQGVETPGNPVSDFVARIAETPEGTNLDERILDYKINVDGPMATAWTPYEFYVNDNFSHCGVNSFQLVKKEGGWKIVYIIDTRRKEGCK